VLEVAEVVKQFFVSPANTVSKELKHPTYEIKLLASERSPIPFCAPQNFQMLLAVPGLKILSSLTRPVTKT
jgi:hypothetical protein